MFVLRRAASLRRAFSSLPFQKAIELEGWLKQKGLNEYSAKEAAPLLFAIGYKVPQQLLAATNDDLRKDGIPGPLAVVIAKVLQIPPARYSLLGGQACETSAMTAGDLLDSLPERQHSSLAVLDPSSRQPMSRDRLLKSDTAYAVVHDYTFPDEFKAQPKFEEPDHPIVAMEPVLAKGMQYIDNNINKATDGKFRVPPVMIAAPARSGKTLALMQLFNAIWSEGTYIPIFVTFNGQAGFVHNETATEVEEFLRAVITQLDPNAIPPGRAMHTYFSLPRLEHYLSRAGKPIVLLVDELNSLSIDPSPELAELLRTKFLDPVGRYLCFTSHRGISLGEPSAQDNELGKMGEKVSRRKSLALEVAQTFDMAELRRLAPNLTPFEAYLYFGLPGLIVDLQGNQFAARQRLCERLSPEFVAQHFDSVLEQVCSGRDCTRRGFAEFTLRDDKSQFVWPWCFVQACFARLPLLQRRVELAWVITQVPNVSGLADEPLESTLWEYTARAALTLTASCPTGSGAERKVLGKLPSQFHLITLPIPAHIKDLRGAKDYVDQEVRATKGSSATQAIVALAFPMHANISAFDGIIRCSSDQGSYWRGVQIKAGRGYPSKPADPDFPGVLFHGGVAGDSHEENWTYLTFSDIESFLPYSMRRFIPRAWK